MDDRPYRWFLASQLENGLVPTNEDIDRCYTYDQALSALVFLQGGDVERAGKILAFLSRFIETQEASGDYWGFPDYFTRSGEMPSTGHAVGQHGWVLLAFNRYHAQTGTKKYMKGATKLADWLLTLSSREGCIAFGPDEKGKIRPWVSTEHVLDLMAGFRDLWRLTGKWKYGEAAWKMRKWLMWEPWQDEGYFLNGRCDPNYALDMASWAVPVFGKELGPTLRFAEEFALCTQRYKPLGVDVEGFDGGAVYGPNETRPDKDSVWFEGTGQMVVAYRLSGADRKANYFLAEMARCLTPSGQHPGTTGLPYASNPGTPAYGGWTVPDSPNCVAGTSWYLFALHDNNVMSMGTSLDDVEEGNRALAAEVRKRGFLFEPVTLPVLEDAEATDVAFDVSYHPARFKSENAKLLLDNPKVGGGKVVHLTLKPEQAGAWGLVERSYGRPLDMAGFDTLVFRVKANGATIVIQMIDQDREVYEFRLDDVPNTWRQQKIALAELRRSSADGIDAGNGTFDRKILGFRFVVTALSKKDADLFIDDFRVEPDNLTPDA